MGYHEEMHAENTRVFLALVLSFLSVKAAEEEEASAGDEKPAVVLGRELTEEEVKELPEDVREVILRAQKDSIRVRCFVAEPKKKGGK